MPLRFRRSVRIMPGVRLNFGKRGVSVSAGVRGATVTVGRQGIFGNVGIPGTGLSIRERLDSGSSPSRLAADPGAGQPVPVQIALRDDGSVDFTAVDGSPLPPRLVRVAREEMGEDLGRWLADQCQMWNQGIDRLLITHVNTPSPGSRRGPESREFTVNRPALPSLLRLDLWARLWRPRRNRIEAENARRQRVHAEAEAEWQVARDAHFREERKRLDTFELALAGNVEAMHAVFEERLTELDMPWHSHVTFEIHRQSQSLWIDLDLPEIEDLPTEHARVDARGRRILVKKRSDTQIRKEYMQLVHSLTFRVVGEAFALLPTLDEVVVSAFSQRLDKATGRVHDEYLVSSRISKAAWVGLNLNNLNMIDVVETFTRFDTIRNVTKTGIFKPIVPYAPNSLSGPRLGDIE